jgi:hypothetical protein
MSYKSPDQPAQTPPKVDVTDSASLRYWSARWQVTEAELKAAVQKVGVEPKAVAFALGKEAY